MTLAQRGVDIFVDDEFDRREIVQQDVFRLDTAQAQGLINGLDDMAVADDAHAGGERSVFGPESLKRLDQAEAGLRYGQGPGHIGTLAQFTRGKLQGPCRIPLTGETRVRTGLTLC